LCKVDNEIFYMADVNVFVTKLKNKYCTRQIY